MERRIVRSVKRSPEVPGTVYNIRTANHNFFADGVLVHNCDDPNDPETVESEAIRETTLKKFKGYSVTRKNNPNAAIIVIQQRTHTKDVSGYIREELGNYEELIIPTEAEERQTLIFPISGRSPIHREPGDLLDPERYGREQVAEDKVALGSYAWAARHQQRPVPIEGGMIKTEWFRRYTTPPANPERIIQSWDTASKGKETSAPWVCGTWYVFGGNYYLVHVFRKRMGYPEGKRTVCNLALQFNPNEILIEDKSSGSDLIQELKLDGILDERQERRHFSIIDITPDSDKITRMSVESSAIEAGRVFLPQSAPWLPDYEAEMTTFPLSATKDQADMTSQFLKRMRLLKARRKPSVGGTIGSSDRFDL